MPTAARRAVAAATGFCGSCVRRRAVPGCKTCRGCTQRVQDAKKKRRDAAAIAAAADAWCVTCSRLDAHRFDCPEVPPLERDLGPYLPLQPERP